MEFLVTRRPASGKEMVEAVLLSETRNIDFENLQWPGWAYSPSARAVRCELATFDQYSVIPGRDGHATLIASDGSEEDLEDMYAPLIRCAENRIKLRIDMPWENPPPTFVSSRPDLAPHSYEVVLRLSALRLSDLADVRAYLEYWRHKESKDEILAMKPLSKEFAQVAEQTTLFEGLWLPVSVNGKIPAGLRLGATAGTGDIPAELHTEREISFTSEALLTRTVSWLEDGRPRRETAEIARVLSHS